jgi:hypothetical protein
MTIHNDEADQSRRHAGAAAESRATFGQHSDEILAGTAIRPQKSRRCATASS